MVAALRQECPVTTFKECESCAAKPGSPTLCAACLHNRTTIDRLLAALRMSLDGWASAASHSGWSGVDLSKVAILRKEFDA
jgi:hypothetical protein